MLLVWILPLVAAVQFPPFHNTDTQYKCNAFLNDEVDDHIMKYFYSLVNGFIRLLSRQFPHKELLSERFLQGEFDDLKYSFISKFYEWMSYEQWWLLLASSLVLFCALFTVFYVLHSCSTCCYNSEIAENTTDSRHDACKRLILNATVTIIVTANIFAVASLLINSQYAEYGANELPHRLSNCLDDLSLYKRDTDMRIRRLLIDDFQLLNASVVDVMSNAGSWLLHHVKKMSGAEAIDQLRNTFETATEMQERVASLQKEMKSLNNELNRFRADFKKLRRTSTRELRECLNDNSETTRSFCRRAEKMLDDMDNLPFKIHKDIISNRTYEELKQLTDSNISEILLAFSSDLTDIEKELQAEIDHNRYYAQSKLKQIGDDLFVVAETISAEIRHISFDQLQGFFATHVSGNNEYQEYVHYSWGASLVLSGAYALIALYFLFAVCYGICGRRAVHYQGDCCVRSTGSKLFTCGIWLAVLLLGLLSVVTAVMLFLGANVSALICQPLHDPLSRPDMLSLAGRVLAIWRSNRMKNDLSSYMDNRSAADIIRACSRNETLYEVFELDKKYHLFNISQHDPDAYAQLNDYLAHLASGVHVNRPLGILSTEKLSMLESFSNFTPTQVDVHGLEKVNEDLTALDLVSQKAPLVMDLQRANVSPRAVEAVLERLRVIEASSARPLRARLRDLLSNATAVNEQFLNLSLPVSPLLARLQQAHTLLSSHLGVYLDKATTELGTYLKEAINSYTEHVHRSMAEEVTSCAPIAEIVRGSRDALCSRLVDPFNGAWASTLIGLFCMVSTMVMGGYAVRLYRTIHPYSQYFVYEPSGDCSQMCAFTTDTYDPRRGQHCFSTYKIYSDQIVLPSMKTRT